jgi:phosphinothricin acetyltransferase
MFDIRSVTPDDIADVAAIYNHYVAHATCTFATEPEPDAYWQAWLAEHRGPHPAIVAAAGGRAIGWGTLSRWNSRCAYRRSVEDSVYVHPEQHRRGVGAALLGALVEAARQHGHRNVIAQIADHQPASERLHERFGFRRVGCLERVGHKFDRWIDVVIWQLRLDGDDQR